MTGKEVKSLMVFDTECVKNKSNPIYEGINLIGINNCELE